MLDRETFQQVDMRTGTITDVQSFPEARIPAWKLWVDFGEEVGMKKTSAQITDLYQKEDLLGRQVIAVVNFPPKQIGKFMSECLVLWVIGTWEGVVLLQPEKEVSNGLKIS